MNIQDTKFKRAAEGSVLNSGHWFVVHDHRAKEGVTLEDILLPQYWINIAHKFDIGHEIKVLAEDLTFRCLLLVENFQPNSGAQVSVIEYTDLTKSRKSEKLESTVRGYEVKWRAARKWSIVGPGGAILREDMSTREEAEKELNSYSKVLAA